MVREVAPRLSFPYWPLPGPLWHIYTLFFFIYWIYTVGVIRQGVVSSSGLIRNQFQHLLLGTVVAFAGASTNFLLWYDIPVPPFGSIVVPFYVILVTLSAIRYQFMDIRVVFRRSLVYSTLIAFVTAVYLVAVLIMEKWFQGFFGYRSIFATAIVAFVISVFFNPLRDKVQAFVDRALFKATPTELVEQREQLLAEVRKGEQMKAVATLAAGLAHEIKNPLASIKTFTEYLETRHGDSEFRTRFQRIVGGEVERINLIVQQLLEFAKPVPPKLEPVEVPKLVDETLELLNNELVQHQVTVSRRYDGSGHILGDPQQLKQVFLNLILNSLQAMNGSGRLDIGADIRGSELIVSLRDNGCGIAPKDLPHLYEPFFTTKANGTGLGLAVVHGIVREHRGHVEVESQPGQGTTFKLHLPLAA